MPLPSRVVAPSRPESSGLWLLTATLFLLLIVGRMTSYTGVTRTVKKRPTNSMLLPPQSFQLPLTRGTLPAVPAPASTCSSVFVTAATR
ncbi:hypothetical protein [Hymenobacter sp.]|uniref:hypothetical protein n=1 Tax=Hymenobacter sp. TaxID=1898978 RepID=UPI002ED8CF7B